MRSFLGLQDTLYEMASIHAYGERARLPPDMRSELGIDVIVSKGSSFYTVNIDQIAKAIAARIKKMTGKEVAGAIAMVCATFLLATLGLRIVDHRAEIERLKLTSAAIAEVQKNTADAMIAALQSQQSFYRMTSRQGFDSLKINGQMFTREELRDIVKTERRRHAVETKVHSGKFMVTDIHFEDDAIYLNIVRPSDGLAMRYVNLLADTMSRNDYQWFKDSASRLEVEMTIVATVKNGEIIASYLQSFSLPPKNEEQNAP